MGVLSAVDVVLARFVSFNVWNMKIGTGFIPVIVAAILFGPVAAGIVGALGDFIGAILFPIGTYFPAFTVTAFISGIIYGIFLHSVKNMQGKNAVRIMAAVLLDQFVLALFVNSYWISVLYGAPYKGLIATRVIQVLIMTAIELICIPIIAKLTDRYGKDLLSQ